MSGVPNLEYANLLLASTAMLSERALRSSLGARLEACSCCSCPGLTFTVRSGAMHAVAGAMALVGQVLSSGRARAAREYLGRR